MKPNHPRQRCEPSKYRQCGLTVWETLLVVAVLAVLAALFLPGLAKSRMKVKRIGCTNNLKQIGLSFRLWAGDNNDKFPDQVSVTNGGTRELVGSGMAYVHFLVMSNELSTPRILVCPADTNRLAATNWNSFGNGNLGYFVALNATDRQPQMFLSGDDNFKVNGVKPRPGLLELWTNSTIAWLPTRHFYGGNIGLADGSVQGFSSARLQLALVETGMATNRLVVP